MAEETTAERDESTTDTTRKPSSPVVRFFYQRKITGFVFSLIPSNFPPGASTGHLLQTRLMRYRGIARNRPVGLINSSNGLIFLYRTKPSPHYLVHNPITHDSFTVRIFYEICPVSKRFMVFGFAFDPNHDKPYFAIVQVSDIDGPRIKVTAYTSSCSHLPRDAAWVETHHDPPARVSNKYFSLSGPSVFHRGALHWLLEPSGIVAYDIHTKLVSFLLMNVPGNERYVDGDGVCNYVKKVKNVGLYSNACCSCRYLGESGDKLVYVRVTHNSRLTMWTLVDYGDGVWSPTGDIVVDKLPRSLYFGRVLAFDRTKPRCLFLLVGNGVFSYSCISGELKKVCKIVKKYGGRKNCLGVIIPYELQSIAPSIAYVKHLHLDVSKKDSKVDAVYFKLLFRALKKVLPCAPGKDRKISEWFMRRAKEFGQSWNDDKLFHLYEQFCISQVAGRYFPPPNDLDATGPPI